MQASCRSLDSEKEQAGRKDLPRALLLSGSVGEALIYKFSPREGGQRKEDLAQAKNVDSLTQTSYFMKMTVVALI